VDRLRLYDVDPAATAKAVRNLRGLGFAPVACDGPEAAVEGAEIITTCTADKRRATILTDNMVGAGVHVNAIGGDCPGKTELHPDVLRRADVFVEHAPQTRVEGEIQQMPDDFPVTEMHRVIRGEAPGRVSDRQVTVFDGVGFAVEDFSALRYVHDRLDGTDLYDRLDVIADPDDPRDLWGMLERAAR
jgi:ornithine cyclodeaminase